MSKTNNFSVRVDQKKLEYLKEKQGFQSNQKAIDFLVNYWYTRSYNREDGVKMGLMPEFLEHLPKRMKNRMEKTLDARDTHAEPVSAPENNVFERLLKQKSLIEDVEAYDRWTLEVETNPGLTENERLVLKR